jgi:murein DD-endopeptidase MepM/ murein hydrolase activator NlpD
VLVATITSTVEQSDEAVTVSAFGTTWPTVRTADRRWRSLIGIDLDTDPGNYRVTAEAGAGAPAVSRRLTVVRRAFRTRTLRVAPKYVNPSPDLLARITSDAALLGKVYEQRTADTTWDRGFVRPVPGRANSSFGTRSVFNGEPRNPHGGTDFLSPAGTPIHAPAGGRVAIARDLFFTGNTVVIDHGLGVVSILAHLSRMDVTEGAEVEQGEVVGLVGATGRVTGPHLHWSLRVGPARVDPLSALRRLPTDRARNAAPR